MHQSREGDRQSKQQYSRRRSGSTNDKRVRETLLSRLERAKARDNTHGVLLRGRHLLYGQRIVKQRVRREVFVNIFLDELNTQIRVIDRFDLVPNTRDWKAKSAILTMKQTTKTTH